MFQFSEWAKVQRGNPTLLIVAAITFTSGMYLTYRHLYAPWALRERLLEAEAFAAVLYKENPKNEEQLH